MKLQLNERLRIFPECIEDIIKLSCQKRLVLTTIAAIKLSQRVIQGMPRTDSPRKDEYKKGRRHFPEEEDTNDIEPKKADCSAEPVVIIEKVALDTLAADRIYEGNLVSLEITMVRKYVNEVSFWHQAP
jgi:hypothetical protein